MAFYKFPSTKIDGTSMLFVVYLNYIIFFKFQSIQKNFFDFYSEKQVGSVLLWQYELSYCELYGIFNNEKVIF